MYKQYLSLQAGKVPRQTLFSQKRISRHPYGAMSKQDTRSRTATSSSTCAKEISANLKNDSNEAFDEDIYSADERMAVHESLQFEDHNSSENNTESDVDTDDGEDDKIFPDEITKLCGAREIW